MMPLEIKSFRTNRTVKTIYQRRLGPVYYDLLGQVEQKLVEEGLKQR